MEPLCEEEMFVSLILPAVEVGAMSPDVKHKAGSQIQQSFPVLRTLVLDLQGQSDSFLC